MNFYTLMQCDALTLKNMIKKQTEKKEKRKIILAFILKNILCISFCMTVVILYSILFGTENSIAGVVVLIAVLVFRFVDLGVNKVNGVINVGIIFLIYTFFPYLSNKVNFALGFFIDLLAITVLLILSCHNMLMSNQSTVILSYLLLQGYDVTPEQFKNRAMSLVFGGIVVCIIYYVKHKNKKYRRSIKDLFLEFSFLSFRGRWQIKLALSLSTLILFGRILGLERIMWLGIACLSVLQPSVEKMNIRLKHRPMYVVVGCILFILGSFILPTPIFEQIGILGGLMTGFSGTYQWQTVFNCFGGLSNAVASLGLPMAILLRIVYNTVGSIYAVIFSKIFDLFVNKLSCEKTKDLMRKI